MSQNNGMEPSSALSCLPSWVLELQEEEATKRENWPPKANGRDIDWKRPTNEVYHDPQHKEYFSAKFQKAREKLDYSYHRNPVTARQELQDVILSQVVSATMSDEIEEEKEIERSKKGEQSKEDEKIREQSACRDTNERPWLVFSAGPMGVGKSYVLSTLNEKGLFPLNWFLQIDPDKMKSELPEMTGYLQVDPDSAATKMHRESTQMADVLLEYALETETLTLVDGSLRDTKYYQSLINRIRRDYPEFQLAILHVTADPDEIRNRAKDRAEKSGRAVPHDLLESTIEEVPKSVQALAPFVDITFTISNNGDQPMELMDVKHGDNSLNQPLPSLSWQSFRDTWTKPEFNQPWCDSQCPDQSRFSQWKNDDKNLQNAEKAFSQAFPSLCLTCTLGTDAGCGKCIHDNHWCRCSTCRPSQNSCRSCN